MPDGLSSEQPLVDILMATYNGEEYIAEQIDSIRNQTYTNWRLFISDDGSTDETLTIARYYSQKDLRIFIVESKNKLNTASGNFFGLLTYSDAPYAMFCDQDDVWDSDKIEISLNRIQELEFQFGKKEKLLVFTDSKLVNQNLEEIAPSFVASLSWDPNKLSLAQAVYGNVAQGATMCMNHELVNFVLTQDIDDTELMHDWWIFLVALAVGQTSYIDKTTLRYRQHDHNVVGVMAKENFFEWCLRVIKNPNVAKGFFENARASEMRAIKRAKNLLHIVQNDLNDEDSKALNSIILLEHGSIFYKTKTYHSYKLIRANPLHYKILQCLGLLLV